MGLKQDLEALAVTVASVLQANNGLAQRVQDLEDDMVVVQADIAANRVSIDTNTTNIFNNQTDINNLTLSMDQTIARVGVNEDDILDLQNQQSLTIKALEDSPAPVPGYYISTKKK